MKTPKFWWKPGSVLGVTLFPVSMVYAFRAARPFGKGISADIPVLCIGNFVVGGAGKTPLAIALAKRLKKLGKRPVFLTRGYGGALQGPHFVDERLDTAAQVGDEALLLSEHADTIVAADRVSGVQFITQNMAADIIVMDDGFQSAAVKPAHAAIAVDSARGLGNGHVLPAGPLRAHLATQIKHADSLFVMHGAMGEAASVGRLVAAFERAGKAVYYTHLEPVADLVWPEKSIAFSGIAHPAKFFQSLRQSGAEVVKEFSFPDHHFFTERDARKLLKRAERLNADLVTTPKDAVRLKGREGALALLNQRVKVFDVEVVFDDEAAIDRLLAGVIAGRNPV